MSGPPGIPTPAHICCILNTKLLRIYIKSYSPLKICSSDPGLNKGRDPQQVNYATFKYFSGELILRTLQVTIKAITL